MGLGIHILLQADSSFFVSAQQDNWILPLRITESSGRGTSVVLKSSPDASDGQDALDIPIPPPPIPPYVRAWFVTPYPIPYNNLLNESKNSQSQRVQWNLSIVWMPESENDETTTISITWETDTVTQSAYTSLQLYENSTVIADFRTQNSYSFESVGRVHRFRIIGEVLSTDNTTDEQVFPVIQIALGVMVVVVLIFIVIFVFKRKH